MQSAHATAVMAASLLGLSALKAAELHVPADHPSIQAAVDAAREGDVVLVWPGLYRELLHFDGKDLVVSSLDPSDPDVVAGTVIDGLWAGTVVTFSGQETERCVLTGFTIRHGLGKKGGGIYGGEPSVAGGIGTRAAVVQNVIVNNEAATGGGIANCDGVIRGNIVRGNRARGAGGGIWHCDGWIQGNTVVGNTADNQGGGICGCFGLVENNLVMGNVAAFRGGGINLSLDPAGLLRNNTVVCNSAGIRGGGMNGCVSPITNSILWGNTAPEDSQISGSSRPSFSFVQTAPGAGGGDIDPLFADPEGRDFHLRSQAGRFDPVRERWVNDPQTSPLIDGGDPHDPVSGEPFPNGAIVNMGAYGGTPSASRTQVEPDWLVQRMVERVQAVALTKSLQALQGFGTRFTDSPGNVQATAWLAARLSALGLTVEQRSFLVGGAKRFNVVARLVGRTTPGEIVVLAAHLDSTSEIPYQQAPGADDNASGLAGLLEAARILRDHAFERTIELHCFNAAEQGRVGSHALAEEYRAAGKDLVAVLNADMIGYWPDDGNRDLDVLYEGEAEWLADHVVDVARRFGGIPAHKKPTGACESDHLSFHAFGYPAVTCTEAWEALNGAGETLPHHHHSSDLLDTLNLERMTQVVKVNLAAVAELARPRALLARSTTISAADGGTVLLNLSVGPAGSFRPYRILGSVSGVSPGTSLGQVWLPLNWDAFTTQTLIHANNPAFQRFAGLLDAGGSAKAAFSVPPTVLAGASGTLRFHFAFPLLKPVDFASNSVQIDVVP